MSPRHDLATAVVGSWELLTYTSTTVDGSDEQHPLGPDARGVLVYTAAGAMSVQIGRPGRPPYADGALHGGSDEERAVAAAGYLAYAGTYTVDDDVITHLPTVSLFPGWEGAHVPRRARLDGDVLRLSLLRPILQGGIERDGTLTWRRYATTPPDRHRSSTD